MQSSFFLRFDPSEDAAIHWAARTGLEHALDLRQADQLYARALPYLKNWAWALAAKHGWTDEAIDTVGDMPLAVCLGRDELLQNPQGDLSYVSRLVLPQTFSDFLNPEFTDDWAAMFSHLTTYPHPQSTTDIFQLGRAGIPRPLQNILYLLQILSPGLLVVRSLEDEDEFDEWGTQGIDLALPPSIWVGLHIEDLEDIFGAQAALKLYQASEDPYCASEVATTSASSTFGTHDTFDSFSDSSSSGFYSEEDWPALDVPEYEQDISFLQYDKPFGLEESRKAKTNQVLAPYAQQNYTEDHHHHPHTENAMVANLMDYRHCDSDCAFCGMCSDRFAERLTERLLMHSALVAM